MMAYMGNNIPHGNLQRREMSECQDWVGMDTCKDTSQYRIHRRSQKNARNVKWEIIESRPENKFRKNKNNDEPTQ